MVQASAERVYRLAWRLVGGDAAAAEDVVQDALVRALRGLSRFRGEASLETWLTRIVVRTARSHCRWAALRRRWTAPAVDLDAAGTSGDGARDVLLRRRLADAVRTLRGPQREVFVLIHLEGYTVRETAALLARSDGTVKSHLHRALVKLRALLADDARCLEEEP